MPDLLEMLYRFEPKSRNFGVDAGEPVSLSRTQEVSKATQGLSAEHFFPVSGVKRRAINPRASSNRDRDLDTFALAEGAFYHFGLLLQPNYSRALLHWALVLEHVRRDGNEAGEDCVTIPLGKAPPTNLGGRRLVGAYAMKAHTVRVADEAKM